MPQPKKFEAVVDLTNMFRIAMYSDVNLQKSDSATAHPSYYRILITKKEPK